MWLFIQTQVQYENLRSCVLPVMDHKIVNSVIHITHDLFSKLSEASRLFRCNNVSLGQVGPNILNACKMLTFRVKQYTNSSNAER
jgi:hypothetical protein